MKSLRVLLCCLLAGAAFAAAPPPATPVAPTTAPVSAGAGQPNGRQSDQPIEINSDQLEVRQQENVAVFTGNVIAKQGTTTLKSDVMTVHYKKKGADAASSAAPAASDALAPGQNSIERIDVEGHVFIITPEETASGDRGVYEVDKRQVRLLDHVVLTRGKNILKGDTLVHDLDTGKSVVNSQFYKEQATPGAVNGRVRALFVPEKKSGQGSSSSQSSGGAP